jgi:hypothetical protein
VTVKLVSVMTINLKGSIIGQHNRSICRSRTYIVPLIREVVLSPKIAPPGCLVVAVVPLMFANGVKVVFNWEIHAANCPYARQGYSARRTRGCREPEQFPR